jgi:hypothetical protein
VQAQAEHLVAVSAAAAVVADGLAGGEGERDALDAYLAHVRPHTPDHGARPYALPAGNSLQRSRARARAVIDLLPATGPRRVLVIGVVNSLLERLRERGLAYVPCDLKGGVTEWGETVRTDARAELAHCDAILASGMTLGNGTFQPLLDHAAATGTPLVMFAQTGSAILPRFLRAGVSALCAEPYPFFWLDGGPGTIHRYGGPGTDDRDGGPGTGHRDGGHRTIHRHGGAR